MIDSTKARNNMIRYPINSISVPVTKKPMRITMTETHIPAMIICLLCIEDSLSFKGRPVFKFLLLSFVPL